MGPEAQMERQDILCMLTKAWRRPQEGKGYCCVMASLQSQSLKKTAPEPAGPSCASFPMGRKNPYCEVERKQKCTQGELADTAGRMEWNTGAAQAQRAGGKEHGKAG